MQSYCPLGRRSCIGLYRRNVLSLKQTLAWVLLWCLSGIVDIGLQAVFIFYKEEWTSETIFWIWNIKGAASNELFHILIPFALSVPTDEGSEDSSDFYVQKPSVLVPRRPCEKALLKPGKRILVQEYVRTSAPPKKKEENSERCPKEMQMENVPPLHYGEVKQARKPRSYASPKLLLTDSLTGVKCRATSVAKNWVKSSQL